MVRKVVLTGIFIFTFLSNSAAAQDFSGRKVILKPVDYKLNIRLDYKQKKLFVSCRFTVLNPTDNNVNFVPLVIYRLMRITSIKDSDGNSLEYKQNIIPYEDWERYHVNFISLGLSFTFNNQQIR